MDSHFREPSPPRAERGWRRDDAPVKEERERSNSFYRGRSPGTESRARRRSRSPAAMDRYEPRSRIRDDYAGPRDRDDRRRVGSPPANIDRYVPGQEPTTQPLVNPIPDPVKLSYQVGFSYFGEWWRANEKIKDEKERLRTGRRREPERGRTAEDRDKEKAKIQAAYDTYKEELQSRMAQTFVKQHKEEQWFRERYVPEIRDAFRQHLNEIRKGAYTRWEQDLESGTFDDFSLEGIPKNDSNGAGGMMDKEEGEATTNEVMGVGDLVPVKEADIRDDNLYQPTLLIKTIAPSVSRQNLEAFCKEHLGEGEGGFKWLSLSDPNPSKRYHRIGWIMLHPASEHAPVAEPEESKDDEDGEFDTKPVPLSTAQKALEAINSKTVKDEHRGDFTCHVGVHNPPSNPRKKALWDLFSDPSRIDKDLELARRLINKFEEDFGSDFNAILKIEERVEDMKNQGRLVAPIPPMSSAKKKKERLLGLDESLDVDDGGEGEFKEEEEEEEGAILDEDFDDETILTKKKLLDLMIEYLRRVFNFCFFCVFESDSIHELTRKCPGGHLRRPRSTLTSSAKSVAEASAAGEPFPMTKRKDSDEMEEGEAPETEKKFRAFTKSEQQLYRAFNWVKTFEDKIMQILEPESVDIRKLGGKPVEDAVNEEMTKFVKQEDEHKWRCKVPECTKLFKEVHFWKKHVEKRHGEWLDKLREEFELVNAYVMDPAHIAPSRTDANSNGHFPPANGQQPTGTPRGFNLSQYTMNSMLNLPGFPMPMFANMMSMNPPVGAGPGWHAQAGDDRGGGPIRRGGPMGAGSRYQSRTGPYDRRQNPRWGGDIMNGAMGGRGRGGPANRWGDGAAGGAAMGPREAVQGRTIKSYEDLDQVSGGGGGELNY